VVPVPGRHHVHRLLRCDQRQPRARGTKENELTAVEAMLANQVLRSITVQYLSFGLSL
jgi:hypothetical protein